MTYLDRSGRIATEIPGDWPCEWRGCGVTQDEHLEAPHPFMPVRHFEGRWRQWSPTHQIWLASTMPDWGGMSDPAQIIARDQPEGRLRSLAWAHEPSIDPSKYKAITDAHVDEGERRMVAAQAETARMVRERR